jgi:hypothetical protein
MKSSHIVKITTHLESVTLVLEPREARALLCLIAGVAADNIGAKMFARGQGINEGHVKLPAAETWDGVFDVRLYNLLLNQLNLASKELDNRARFI